MLRAWWLDDIVPTTLYEAVKIGCLVILTGMICWSIYYTHENVVTEIVDRPVELRPIVVYGVHRDTVDKYVRSGSWMVRNSEYKRR